MKILKEFGRNPYVDWIAVLFLSFILVVILAYTGFSLYNSAVTGTIKEKVVEQVPVKLNEKAIEKAVEVIDAKKAASDEARAGYNGVTDPSL